MDVFWTILYAVILLSILVFIHEAGHYLTARAFKVRVTEFMLGLPGPGIGFTWRGTRFGVTAIPLGGYALICGMGSGEQSPHLQRMMTLVYERGTVVMEDAARLLGIEENEAAKALEQLGEWGTIVAPLKKDAYNTYRAPAVKGEYALGAPREVADSAAFYESEYRQQFCSLSFWRRAVILLGGIAVNLLFAILVMVLIFSVIGVDVMHPDTGEMVHRNLNPLQAISVGFNYIGMVVTAVAGLFNPATAAETVSGSASIIGIAAYSKQAADAGFVEFIFFMAAISVSLGVMNLIPIPPLDGGKLLIEIIQKVARRPLPEKAIQYVSIAGMVLFVAFFLVMINQDIQRFVLGNW